MERPRLTPRLQRLPLIAFVAAVLILATGCLPIELDEEAARSRTTSTTTAAVLDTAGVEGQELPDDTEAATVSDVVDGDTIEVTFPPDNLQVDIRIIGINAPESVRPNYPVECYGPEASDRLAELLPGGTTVYLQQDVSETDQFDRLLRHAWIVDEASGDAYLVSEILVRGGFVDARAYRPDDLHDDRLADAERAARDEGAGMWGACDG